MACAYTLLVELSPHLFAKKLERSALWLSIGPIPILELTDKKIRCTSGSAQDGGVSASRVTTNKENFFNHK